jgi:hypothetical protein
MATWKKIITSGSNAELNQITASTGFNGSGRDISFADTAMATADSLVFVDAGGGTKKDTVADVVTLLAGDGIQNSSNKFAIDASDIAGTGLEADGEDIRLTAANTALTSIFNTSLAVGADNQTQIDFGTDNQIHFDVNNTELLNLTGAKISGSFVSTGSFGRLTAVGNIHGTTFVGTNVITTGNVSGSSTSTGSFGKLIGDGSELTGVSQDIDTLSAFSGVPHATDDEFLISDDGTEKRATMTMVANGAFALVSGEATIAAGGALTIAANVIGNNELKQDDDITLQSLTTTNNVTIGGDLTVNGTTTTVATTNTEVADQFIFLASGSAASNVDAGIIVQSGSAHNSGSAFYHDKTDERWSVAQNMGKTHTGAAQAPTQFVTTVKTDSVNPNDTSGSYGAGEMHVNTTTGEIWIRFG